jgi:asparagine synthase (glutamine-hydrolysing)
MDASSEGDQPFTKDGVSVVCNGEIYNYQSLIRSENLHSVMTSKCDCEVILHLYLKYGFHDMVSILDGYYAIILHDYNKGQVWVTRDGMGVRPLYIGHTEMEPPPLPTPMASSYDSIAIGRLISASFTTPHPEKKRGLVAFSSEQKGLKWCCGARQLEPGLVMCYSVYSPTQFDSYCLSTFDSKIPPLGSGPITYDSTPVCDMIGKLLCSAVAKRCTADRDIACMLSGGLDSSLVAALLAAKVRPARLKTFSIGFDVSADITYARLVAKHINSDHTEILLTENDFLDAIPHVIQAIESYDITTVRASVGNYLLAKYVSQNTQCKVLFNGDYSDELLGGYQFLAMAPNEHEFDLENRKLVKEIHFFDSLRSDRCTAAWGLEARTPYADRAFATYVMSLAPKVKMHYRTAIKQEKQILRDAFRGMGLIPDAVLNRSKCAFSDGVSSKSRSWSAVIKEHVDSFIRDGELTKAKTYTHMPPTTKEGLWYRRLYEYYYPGPGFANPVPHYWMPNVKWPGLEGTSDPSARTLVVNEEAEPPSGERTQ